jgi:hypothetical protein
MEGNDVTSMWFSKHILKNVDVCPCPEWDSQP